MRSRNILTKNKNMHITENFTFREFEESATAYKLDIINVIADVEVRDSIMALVRNVLQPLRSEIGKPCTINSGYRCKALNEAVGGQPTSQHTKGEAADIKFKGVSPYNVAKTIIALHLPYDQIVLYNTFVHVSHKLKGEQRKMVVYNKEYKGKRF